MPSASDPSSTAVARFREDLIALADPLPERIGVAVSGGPDSMALLLLAAAALPGKVHAATVDHGLRAGSADEAALVAALSASRAIPHATLHAGPIVGASLQAQARTARYAALGTWATAVGIGAILTAHHADDQAETFLMRAARGAGVPGLAGVRSRATIASTLVLRPLLTWRRSELRSIVERAGVAFVDDPANDDPRHDRTHARRLLADTPWLDPAAIARSAHHVAAAEQDIAALADWLWRERWREDAIDPTDLPREFQRRLVRRAIGTVRDANAIETPAFDDSSNVESLLDALIAGRGATHGGIQASGARGRWLFRPAPPRRS